jgi:hypothetical protein
VAVLERLARAVRVRRARNATDAAA